jgi:two-component system CheB/CheR fusion protein
VSLLEEYAPPSVVVNPSYDIVHLSENVGRFFQLTGGEPTMNLLKVVHPDLRIELRTALFRAVQSRAPVSTRPVALTLGGSTHMVSMRVRPARESVGQGFILVVFEDAMARGDAPLETQEPPEPATRQLEAELQQVRSNWRASSSSMKPRPKNSKPPTKSCRR